MSDDTWSLAEISTAILSYNAEITIERPTRAIKDEIALSRQPPQMTSAKRMRRHDDRDGADVGPIR